MKHAGTAESITELLDLDLPPVALAFVEKPPPGVETTNAVMPSSCSFWRQAERGVFYAPAEAHFNCAVGAMVMGFELPESVQRDLGAAVEMMCDVSYLGADEPAHLPTVKREKAGIVYGPLSDFPIEPDVVILWVTSRQAMLVNEAAGSSRWVEAAPRTVFGRPACAAIPSALDAERPVLSLGCTGMRTFTEILPDRLLTVVPGATINEFERRLVNAVEANRRMLSYYEEQKAQLV